MVDIEVIDRTDIEVVIIKYSGKTVFAILLQSLDINIW